MELRRITGLPPYVFAEINELKLQARRAGDTPGFRREFSQAQAIGIEHRRNHEAVGQCDRQPDVRIGCLDQVVPLKSAAECGELSHHASGR